MKKRILLLIPILAVLLSVSNVNAITLGAPTRVLTHDSNSDPNSYIVTYAQYSANAYGYPNYASPFSNYSVINGVTTLDYNDWYKFTFDSLINDCPSSATIEGTFVTWTTENPGTFSNQPFVKFINANGDEYNCNYSIENNGNELQFFCPVSYMTSTGTFQVGFGMPFYPDFYDSWVGISTEVDITCDISTGDIISNDNKNTQDIINADSDPSVNPDDSKYDDYESVEGSLKDKVNQADLSNLSIGIDSNSSKWIWETLTSLLQSHSAIFGMVIAILSIGIIKLALGR